MTDYAKLSVSLKYSQNDDYTDEDWKTNFDDYEQTPDEGETRKVEALTGGGTTVNTAHLASATTLVIKNLDTTNYVTATYYTTGGGGGGGTAQTSQIQAGAFLVIPDYITTSNLVLVANGAALLCRVAVCGS